MQPGQDFDPDLTPPPAYRPAFTPGEHETTAAQPQAGPELPPVSPEDKEGYLLYMTTGKLGRLALLAESVVYAHYVRGKLANLESIKAAKLAKAAGKDRDRYKHRRERYKHHNTRIVARGALKVREAFAGWKERHYKREELLARARAIKYGGIAVAGSLVFRAGKREELSRRLELISE